MKDEPLAMAEGLIIECGRIAGIKEAIELIDGVKSGLLEGEGFKDEIAGTISVLADIRYELKKRIR